MSTTTSTSTTAAVSRTLRGHVVNAATGAAIPRVLVQVGARTVLTDSQGRFELPEFTDTQAYVTLTHPQFSQTDTMFQEQGRQRLADLDAVAELKMYPDAVISGTVTGRDGLPLSGVGVELLRQVFIGQGGLLMQPVNFAQTNLSGEFRFRVPAGRFELSLAYLSHARDTGEAVLPLVYPEHSGGSQASYFEAAPGEEKHLDLRPRTGPVYPYTVRVDGADSARGIQFTAMTTTNEVIPGGGSSISSPSEGVYQISLPKGTYTLQALRMENRDAVEMTGTTRITVTGNQSEPGVIHLEPAISLPVEVSLDPASAPLVTATSSSSSSSPNGFVNGAQSAPNPMQFNLLLQNNPLILNMMRQSNLRQRPDKSYEFRVEPGRYRLTGNGGGAWYVESATYGVTDALTNDIVVSSGSSAAPIRLVVNNVYGMVTGTVQFANATDPVWVYLIPTTPTLTPVNPIGITNTGAATATFSTRAPAGTYLAVALDHRVTDDLHNPEVISRFSSSAQPVTLSAAATATVNLTISNEKEPGK
jgi:hypothetical protein